MYTSYLFSELAISKWLHGNLAGNVPHGKLRLHWICSLVGYGMGSQETPGQKGSQDESGK